MSIGKQEPIDLIGTLRACRPEATLAFIRPLFGAVGLTRLARVTGLDRSGVHVSIAVRPLSRSLSVSQGKGLTAELADVSAAMEAIELWHAEELRPPDIEGSFSKLSAEYALVDPMRLPEGLYPRSVDLHRTATGWYRGLDLISGADSFVPDYAVDMRADWPRAEWARVLCSSNGLASGNTRDEAICHALFEVIERDAIARFDLERPERAAEAELDLGSVDGPARRVVEALDTAGMRLRVWDATSDAGVPTFRCHVSSDSELRGLATALGQGAHLSKDIALLRAITEAVQSRLTVIAGSRDDQSAAQYAEMRRLAGQAQPRGSQTKSYARMPSPEIPADFQAIAGELTRRMKQVGATQAVVVDLSKPELGVPVVSVHVPGGRHDAH